MGKNKNKAGHDKGETAETPVMKRREFEKLIKPLHGELVAVQEWAKSTGAKIVIVFEGRDTAGKGGVIKAITERVSPRVFRVVALPTPTPREKSQMYVQRYVSHFPAAGEIVIFDRSWYNRAGVERVMGFCTEEESKKFLEIVPTFERAMVESGILLLKYWLEVSAEQQTLRLQSRIEDPRKYWKLSAMDLKSYSRWYDYSRARDDMFRSTDTAWAPWFVADTNDKKRGRLNIITHMLDQIPYEPLESPDIELPKRQAPDGYEEPAYSPREVPAAY
ncbi:polyphosphate kinase 2 [Arthrobacter sp. I2-34]|uniref:ADP/GDP-polyphosphate phosphotransferase n=1 Tax=Arthrobacter hankyongi TaxID=2904801 RepID=A0ABS9LDW2_9MICC|nr:polyphosphate kinase 2 [Arthrobacter hankyongi]MCG2624894.1 polyphosphate kinase 2 [Arthrobacter hankyongi]